MHDFADLVVITKRIRRGAEDALRDVRKQVRRNRHIWDGRDEALPVYGTISSQFADPGVDAAYLGLIGALEKRTWRSWASKLTAPGQTMGSCGRRPATWRCGKATEKKRATISAR